MIDIDDETRRMLNQECPRCGSAAGDIIFYNPALGENTITFDVECENCGAEATIQSGPNINGEYHG